MVVLCSQSGPLQNPVCMKGALLTQCTKNDSHVFNRVSMFSTFLVQHFHFQHFEGRGTCMHVCHSMHVEVREMPGTWISFHAVGLGDLTRVVTAFA